MNRRQKIIVSVTGIALVSLILIGLTYGYFLTKISGNTNDKSISVSTANLQLVYGNDDNNVIGENELIEPGTIFDAKTFTVTNDGNATTDYVVVVENATSTFTNNDFVYTLNCISDGGSCTGVDTETLYPMNGGILVNNTIEEGETQTYSFILKYIDTNNDQSVDMNKKIEGKLNIKNISEVNPYSNNTNSLAYNTINNAVNLTNEEKSKGYAELRIKPLTTPAVEVSLENESILSITYDDLGTSYYYRGNVKNNYVEFGDMCWRIVRIEGDSSIKLVLAAQKKCNEITDSDTKSAIITMISYGYTEIYVTNSSAETSTTAYKKANYLNSETGMKSKLDAWLESSELDKTKLKQDSWCLGNWTDIYNNVGTPLTVPKNDLIYNGTAFYYEVNKRLFGRGTTRYATLKCSEDNNEVYSSYIGSLTADEVVFAGGKTGTSSLNYYLMDNAVQYWNTLSLSSSSKHDLAFSISTTGSLNSHNYISVAYGVRPVVTLIPNTIISDGIGIQSDPYIIE